MNKWKLFLIALLVVAATALIFMEFFYREYATLSFEKSGKVLTNPFRGFYVQFDSSDTERFNTLSSKNISMVLLAFDIKDFVDAPISGAKLQELDNAFEKAKQYGLSVIFRAAYGFSSEAAKGDPTNVERMKGHIVQIQPILEKHKAVLLSVQAGFLGPWGEWHSTNLAGSNGEIPTEVMNELVEALCEGVPEPISVALRRPRFIRAMDENKIPMERIAFHNDALLSGALDMGTYDDKAMDREAELAYIHDRTAVGANGGEMTGLSGYTGPERALYEFEKLRLTYLNHEYNQTVLDNWRNTTYAEKNFFKTVQNRLGYRLALEQVRLPRSFKANHEPNVSLQVCNDGFSDFAIPFVTELVVYDGVNYTFYPLYQGGYPPSETVEMKTTLPEQTGSEIELGLCIRSEDGSLREDQRYRVLLATKNLKVKSGIHFFATYTKDSNGKYQLAE